MFSKVEVHVLYGREGVEIEEKSDTHTWTRCESSVWRGAEQVQLTREVQ